VDWNIHLERASVSRGQGEDRRAQGEERLVPLGEEEARWVQRTLAQARLQLLKKKAALEA